MRAMRIGRHWYEGLWFTNEPIEPSSNMLARLMRGLKGREAVYEGEPTPGSHEFMYRPHAIQFHNRALASGYESQLKEFDAPKLGKWWMVEIRNAGDRKPEFVGD